MSDRAIHSEGDPRAIPCTRCTKVALRGNSCITCCDTTWGTGRPVRSCYKCYTNHDACLSLPEDAVALTLKFNIAMKTKGETDPGVRKLRTILTSLLEVSKQEVEQPRTSGASIAESILLESMAAHVGAAAKKIVDGLSPAQTANNREKTQQYRIPKRQETLNRDHPREHQNQPSKQEERGGRGDGGRNQSGANQDSNNKRVDEGRYRSQSPTEPHRKQQAGRESRTRYRSQSRHGEDRRHRSRSPRLDDRHVRKEERKHRSQSQDHHHRHHRSQSPHHDTRKGRGLSRERHDQRKYRKRTPDERRSPSQSPRRGYGHERPEHKATRGVKHEAEEIAIDEQITPGVAARRARLKKLLSDFSEGLVDLLFN